MTSQAHDVRPTMVDVRPDGSLKGICGLCGRFCVSARQHDLESPDRPRVLGDWRHQKPPTPIVRKAPPQIPGQLRLGEAS